MPDNQTPPVDENSKAEAPQPAAPDLPLIKHSNSYMSSQNADTPLANATNTETDSAKPVGLEAEGGDKVMTEEEKREADMEAREKLLESGFQEQ